MWAVNGVGLALVIPSGQSLIADYYPPASRGRAFGALYLTGAVGGMLGSLYATNMGARTAGRPRTSFAMPPSRDLTPKRCGRADA